MLTLSQVQGLLLASTPPIKTDKVLIPLNLVGGQVGGHLVIFFSEKEINIYDSLNKCTPTLKHTAIAKSQRA